MGLAHAAETASPTTPQVDADQIREQCNSITPQQRQMAKAAGYDLDSLCNSFESMTQKQSLEQPTTVEPRSLDEKKPKDIEEPFDETTDGDFLPEDPKELLVEDDELKQFGYELFAGVPTTFAPATDIPVRADYVIGPGDTVNVQLFGKTSASFELLVQRDGKINFPELGPISLSGLTYSEMKELLVNRVKEQMIGVNISVTMGELRSIQVFVLGEAYRPGSYTISSLSTMTNALFSSGGITEVGSLRNIQLKRRGEIISTLDLYDLLLRGDTSDDSRLLPGDVLFVPPIGDVATISGEVKRPAIYELKEAESAGDLLRLSGGLLPNAFPDMATIERIKKSGDKTVVNLNLASSVGRSTSIKNGDFIQVPSVLDRMENIVTLSGHVHRPGTYQWRKGMRVSDLIKDINSLLPNSDVNYAVLKREKSPLRELEVLHINLRDVFSNKGSKADILLNSRDELIVLDLLNPRDVLLVDVVDQLKLQSTTGKLAQIVTIRGDVNFPGEYPLTDNMTINQLVQAAGGLKEAAYLNGAELTRQDLTDAEKASIKHIEIDLAKELSENRSFELQPKDKLSIFTTPEYSEDLTITLEGEVLFPGIYEFKRGETLSQVIARSGGFTSMAHVQASVFTRKDLKAQEAKQLEELRERMREDIAASELEEAAAGKGASIKDADTLLNALSETEALGRLVISLEDIVSGKTADIQLKDGDYLVIPTFRQEVSVLGEVQHSTSHLYNQEWMLEDYIEKSGGLTNRADDDRIYVVKADGSVFLPNQSGWLTHQNEMLSPGDTIVVPLDTDRIKSLALWTSVSQIVYQLALGAAAVKSL